MICWRCIDWSGSVWCALYRCECWKFGEKRRKLREATKFEKRSKNRWKKLSNVSYKKWAHRASMHICNSIQFDSKLALVQRHRISGCRTPNLSIEINSQNKRKKPDDKMQIGKSDTKTKQTEKKMKTEQRKTKLVTMRVKLAFCCWKTNSIATTPQMQNKLAKNIRNLLNCICWTSEAAIMAVSNAMIHRCDVQSAFSSKSTAHFDVVCCGYKDSLVKVKFDSVVL